MSKRWLLLIPFVCGLPLAAEAQTTGVVINLSAFRTIEEQRINIEDLEEEVQATIQLSWSVSGLTSGNFDYELTYGAITETSTAPTRLRVEDSEGLAEAEGDQPLTGELQVEILPINIIENDEDLPQSLGGQGRDDYNQAICVNVFPDGNPDFNETFSECWTFEVDTLAPAGPPVDELIPGENRVTVRWTPLADNNIQFYEVVYCVNTSTLTVSFDSLPCPENEWIPSGTISDTQGEVSISDGIITGERVVVGIRAIDEFDNIGEPGDVEDTFPTTVDDFFELYDGPEAGGFCFIATAAYGSYAHPLVRVLRAFRDRVLNATPLGAAFVWAYYHYAPPLAERVGDDPSLAIWIRVWLVPVAMVAMLIMLCPLVAAAWLAFRTVRWARRRARTSVPGVVAVAALLWANPAEARRPDSDLTTVGVGLEFKGGPYSGNIQNEPGFSDVFEAESRPLFTLGVDLQVLRGFGTVTVGGTVGFLQYSGKGLFGKGSRVPGSPSDDDNDFNLVPLTLQLGYRFDVLADRTWIPLVPYARGGLAYYIWWATNGVGELQRRDQEEDRQTARGGTFGLTGTLGIAFMLNKIEPRVAQSLFANTGIRGTYVFVEMTTSEVDDFGGDSFDLSDFNWSVGLYMEL